MDTLTSFSGSPCRSVPWFGYGYTLSKFLSTSPLHVPVAATPSPEVWICLGQRESSSRFFLPSFKFFSPRISKFFPYLLPLYFLDLYFPLLVANHILWVDNFSYQIVSVYIIFVVSFDWIPSQFLQNLWFWVLFLFVSLFVNFLGCSMQHVGSQFPNQGSNRHPLHWKCGVLPLNHHGRPLSVWV